MTWNLRATPTSGRSLHARATEQYLRPFVRSRIPHPALGPRSRPRGGAGRPPVDHRARQCRPQPDSTTRRSTIRQPAMNWHERLLTIGRLTPVSTNRSRDRQAAGALRLPRHGADARPPHRSSRYRASPVIDSSQERGWARPDGPRTSSAPRRSGALDSRKARRLQASRGSRKKGSPERVRVRHMAPPPPWAVRRTRFKVKPPPQLLEQPITFLHVVPPTRRDDVRPFVSTSATLWHHVVNSVGVFEAVGALVAIAQEQRTTSERWSAHLGGKFDHLVETNDRGDFYDQHGGAAERRILGCRDWLGTASQHEHDRSPFTHQLQRLKGGVEEKNASHYGLSRDRLSQRPPCGFHHDARRESKGLVGAVRRHSKAPVGSVRKWQERGVAPPPFGAKAPSGSHEGTYIGRMTKEVRPETRRPETSHGVFPHDPTRAAPKMGPSLPKPDCRISKSSE